MRDQVFMSPNNAALCVGIPLFRQIQLKQEVFPWEAKVSVSIVGEMPLAYVIDVGEEACVLSAEWVEKNLVNLGDL